MFELITISSGLAVVQHATTGHVYRFRPVQPGLWHALMLERIDATDASEATLGEHAAMARTFAEEAASSICQVAVEAQISEVPMPPPRKMRLGWTRPCRRPALS